MKFAGQTCLVTGAASGLGAAVARDLIEHGAKVVLADLNATANVQLASELGSHARAITCDVTQPEQVQAALNVASREFGDLHGVVHCAGILHAAKLLSKTGLHSLADFERVLRVNLLGTFNILTQAAAAMMINQPNGSGERGVIVLTSSVAAEEGQIGQAAYAASKGGVNALTLPAAREYARYGIRVVTIAPGVMETDLMRAAPAELRESLTAQIPFPARFGLPSEFALLVRQVFENSYLNGCVLRLDGALRMGGK